MAPEKTSGKRDPSPAAPENCTCFNLRKAARAVTQAYDAALQPVGLKATQYSVLAAAAAIGPLTVGKLADRLVMDRTTLTRNLNPLERDGLVRIEEGEDRRARLVTVTPAGRRLLARAQPLWRSAQERMVDRLGRRQWSELLSGLDASVAAAHGS